MSAEAAHPAGAEGVFHDPPASAAEHALRRLSAVLDLAAQAVTSAILVGLLVALFVSIVVRTFRIGTGSVIWIEEASRFSFMWIGFLGATIAYYRREHIVVDILVSALPARARVALGCLVDVLVIVFLLLLTYQGIILMQETGNQFSISLGIQIAYIQLVVPLSAALMLVHEAAAQPAKQRQRRAAWGGAP